MMISCIFLGNSFILKDCRAHTVSGYRLYSEAVAIVEGSMAAVISASYTAQQVETEVKNHPGFT